MKGKRDERKKRENELLKRKKKKKHETKTALGMRNKKLCENIIPLQY